MAKATPTRLYQKGVITSYKRARKDLTPRQSLVKIQGVNTQEQTNYYKGKKIAFVYKCKKEVKGSRFRIIWGKVRRAHGQRYGPRSLPQELASYGFRCSLP